MRARSAVHEMQAFLQNCVRERTRQPKSIERILEQGDFDGVLEGLEGVRQLLEHMVVVGRMGPQPERSRVAASGPPEERDGADGAQREPVRGVEDERALAASGQQGARAEGHPALGAAVPREAFEEVSHLADQLDAAQKRHVLKPKIGRQLEGSGSAHTHSAYLLFVKCVCAA